MIDEQAIRDRLIEHIEGELRKVINNLDKYIPDAVCTSSSTFTVEIGDDCATTVRCDFGHFV